MLEDSAEVLYAYDDDGDLLETSQSPWTLGDMSFNYDGYRDYLSFWEDDAGRHILEYDPVGARTKEWSEDDISSLYFELTYNYAPNGPWQRLVSKDDPNWSDDPAVRLFYSTNLTSADDGLDQAGQVTGIDWGYDGSVDVKLGYGLHGNVTSAEVAGGVYSYAYDAEIRRVRKSAPAPLGHEVVFRYGLGADPLEEYETDGSTFTRTEFIYLNGERVAAVAENPSGAELFYLHTDRMGVVREASKPDGTGVARVIMDPWGHGEVVVDSPGLRPSLQYRYAGQYEDVETGLVENRYRSLIPSAGQYANVDPLHWASSLIFVGSQVYSYAAIRPAYYVDPEGRIIEGVDEQILDVLVASTIGPLIRQMRDDPDTVFSVSQRRPWVDISEYENLRDLGGAAIFSSFRDTRGGFPESCDSRPVTVYPIEYNADLIQSEAVRRNFPLPVGVGQSIAHELGHGFARAYMQADPSSPTDKVMSLISRMRFVRQRTRASAHGICMTGSDARLGRCFAWEILVSFIIGSLLAGVGVWWWLDRAAVLAAFDAQRLAMRDRGETCRVEQLAAVIHSQFGDSVVCLPRCSRTGGCSFGWRCNTDGARAWAPRDACVPGSKWPRWSPADRK